MPFYDDGTVQIHHGDALELLEGLRADVIVTDPPYGLGFMGRAWDRVDRRFHEAWARVALEALEPGGWLLAFGGTRTWHRLACGLEDAGLEVCDTLMWLHGQGWPKSKAGLKPGWEPALLARRPGPNVLQVNACRSDVGRWPANVLLDEIAADLLDRQSGNVGGNSVGEDPAAYQVGNRIYGDLGTVTPFDYGDKGGASRFYYTAKAGRNERVKIDGEIHPTVKPLSLMRWLVRLVTPPGGTVLDPFCGSGSTLVAARMEGFRAIGIEADERWCRGSAQRLAEIPPIQDKLAF